MADRLRALRSRRHAAGSEAEQVGDGEGRLVVPPDPDLAVTGDTEAVELVNEVVSELVRDDAGEGRGAHPDDGPFPESPPAVRLGRDDLLLAVMRDEHGSGDSTGAGVDPSAAVRPYLGRGDAEPEGQVLRQAAESIRRHQDREEPVVETELGTEPLHPAGMTLGTHGETRHGGAERRMGRWGHGATVEPGEDRSHVHDPSPRIPAGDSYHQPMNAKRLVLPAVALGAGVAAATPAAIRRAFAPPRREVHQTPADLGLPDEQVWLPGAHDLRLHAWFIPAGVEPAPAVLALHGWGGNAAHMLPLAPALHEAGLHVMVMDARNHGLSEHDTFTSMPRFAEDLRVAVDHLRSRDDVTSVGVIGHSVGAAAAIYAAADGADVDAVVAVSSFAHPGELMERNFTLPKPVTWTLLRIIEAMIGHRYGEIAPRSRIGDVSVPLMLVHGDRDEVVPVGDSVELHELLPDSELLIVEGGGHSDLEPFLPHFPQVVEFLTANLTAAEHR